MPHNFKIKLIVFALFLCAIYFPIFLHLDSKPLREWDEARNAINALEMGSHYNVLVKTFNNEPDLWETKPPLLEWLQAIGFKIIGVNELTVRLPSALATFFLVIFLVYFFYRHFKLPLAGILASFILITSSGFMFEHCTRTGDHDALLILFEILMLFYFYLYTEHKNKYYLIYFAISLILCVYTKSIACFLFLPGILIYLFISKQLIVSLKDKKLWIAFILAIAGCSVYYIAREITAGGYISAVWDNELFPRYFNTAKTYQYNPRDPSFYFKQIIDTQFVKWYPFIIPAILINEILCETRLKQFHRFILINSVVFLIILSNGTTNSSYILPIIPLLSIIIGIAFYQLGIMLYNKLPLKLNLKIATIIALVILLFYNPYTSILSRIMDKSETNTEVQYAYVFKRIEKELPSLKQFYVFEPSGSNYPLVFYQKVFNEQKHFNISNIDLEKLKNNTLTLIIRDDQLAKIEASGINYTVIFKEFNYLLIQTQQTVHLVE